MRTLRDRPAARTAVRMLLAVILLSGCAGQKAYREGQALAEQGRTEESMNRFREAAVADPGELQYRIAYAQAHERTITKAVEEADRTAAAGNRAAAEKMYNHVLTLEPSNERAQAGLRALAAQPPASSPGKVTPGPPGSANPTQPDNVVAANNEREARSKGLNALSAAYRKPISIEFKDVPLKQVFEVISRSSGLNFIFDRDVRLDQKLTLFLKNSTVEAAVYYTMLTNQLEQQVINANTILIYPNATSKLRDYQEMVVHTFHLTNADAKAVAASLKTIVKTRDIVIDDKLNMLIMRDTPEAIKMATRLVALHDVAEPEVMLEVEILEVKRDRILELGISWPDSLSLTPLPSATSASGTLTLRDLRSLTGATLGAGIGAATVNARKQDTDAKLLANPRIRARNHEKAKVLIGDRVPLITTTSTATGFASESINYLDVGLKLDIEPSVHLDNDVAIKISLEVSNIVSQLQTKSGSIAYQIGTRTASTVLRLKDGENQVLAGLINDEDRRSARKVPGLGDLPILGRLFGSTNDDHQKTEIVLSITPHLIRNIARPDAGLADFASGTESSLRTRPDGFVVPAGTAGPTVTITGQPGGPAPAAAPSAPVQSAPAAPVPAASPAPSPAPVPAPATPAPPAEPGAPAPPGAAGEVHMRLAGAQQIKVGETFTVQLSMESAQPVTSMPLVLTFDSKVLEASDVTEGGFLRQGGTQTSFNSKIDPGRVLVTGTRSGNQGASGDGNFASVNFRALAPASSSTIQVLTAAPTGLAGVALAAQSGAPHVIEVKP